MNPLKNRIAFSILVIFGALTYLFAWSPVFEVSQIRVLGTPQYAKSSQIIEGAEIAIGDKLARVEPRTITRRLSEFQWIKNVNLSRNWINGTVTIEIAARVPVGIYGGKALDATGALFEYPGEFASDLPHVSASTPNLGLRGISLFKALPSDLRASLISISVPNESSIASRHKKSGGAFWVQWGSLEELPMKIRVYKALLQLPENKDINNLNLSAPHAPIAR